jgi:hypothetical protein
VKSCATRLSSAGSSATTDTSRLAELLARADQAAHRRTKSRRQAGSQYAAWMELQVQAGAGQQAEARDELELEL